jgi:hypothetical protein
MELRSAYAAIDAANAEDPNLVGGRPRALVQGELATRWLDQLEPDAPLALRLAARAHHLRRWSIPRDAYPAGRPGYLRWRRDLKSVHAAAAREVLAPLGADDTTLARVAAILTKQGLGHDTDVQAFEDVVCLVFLETQYDDLIARLDDDKIVDVLRKTIPKMSARAVALAASVRLTPQGVALLTRALEKPSA